MKAALEPIAVLGMACQFPGAHSPEELWQNVLAGRRFFRKAPPERLPPEYFDPNPDAPGKSYCDQMAVLTDWSFDPVEFGIRKNDYEYLFSFRNECICFDRICAICNGKKMVWLQR